MAKRRGIEDEWCPLSSAKLFDQTFLKFDRWCKSTKGAKEGKKDGAKERRF